MSQPRPAGRREFPLYVYIGLLFLGVLLFVTAIGTFVQYYQTKRMVLSASRSLFDHIGAETQAAVKLAENRAAVVTSLAAYGSLAASRSLEQRLTSLPFMLEMLRSEPSISGVYIGYDDGDFFSARKVTANLTLTPPVPLPANAAYLVQSQAHDGQGRREGRFLFYTAEGVPIENDAVPAYDYDPRDRAWYRRGKSVAGLQMVAPYAFFTTHEVGATFSRRSPDGSAVAGVDIAVTALSGILRSVRPKPSAELMIFNGKGELLSDADAMPEGDGGAPRILQVDDTGRPVLQALAQQADAGAIGTGTIDVAGVPWQSYVSPLDLPGDPLYFALAVPQQELLIEANRIRNLSLLTALLSMLPLVPLAMGLSKIASRPLQALTHEAKEIRSLHFGATVTRPSRISEINALSQAMADMKATIRQCLDIGAVLASERRFDRLLDRILMETTRIAAARGGAIYLVDPGRPLQAAAARWDEAKVALRDLDRAADAEHPAIRSLTTETGLMPVSPSQLSDWLPEVSVARSLRALAIPLRNRFREIVGVLVLFQEAGRFNEAAEDDVMALVQAVSGAAAIAIETQRLIDEQRQMVEAVVQLVAGAIDSKSPYTGRHCERVPTLAKMIAGAAVAATEGTFRDFSLTDEEWEELHLAAWLHDCGKILTPEFVVDKATKLETITDRLHEVRTRFEVVKREAEVACWRDIAEGAPRVERLAALEAEWRAIDGDFAFVASCNAGSEYVSDEHLARLRTIAERTWTRTLDNRLGISRDERRRMERSPAEILPVREKLLADRADHLLERTTDHDRIADNVALGIRMDVPEYLYNRGELYNLTIRRGTLTAEERFKINEHVVDTIRMLGKVPLPRHLRNVVEIAGGHHERMDGAGYPKRLKGHEMSILARMMAVADIFEALTAADRPYKSGNTLSEAVAILARMRDEGHIDPDIFELFISAGIYRDYAASHLKPSQIDAFDAGKYLKPQPERRQPEAAARAPLRPRAAANPHRAPAGRSATPPRR